MELLRLLFLACLSGGATTRPSSKSGSVKQTRRGQFESVVSSGVFHMFSRVELRRSGSVRGLPNPAVEKDCCDARSATGDTWELTKEFGGTRGNLRDMGATLSIRSFLWIMTPWGAAQADSTSKGMCTM